MYRILSLTYFIFLFLLSLNAHSQRENNGNVYLKSGVIEADSPLWKSVRDGGMPHFSQPGSPFLGIIRLNHHPGEKEKASLQSLGVHLQGYIPHYAWVAVFSRQPDRTELAALGCEGILELTPELKTDPQLLAGQLTPSASKVTGMADLQIGLPPYYQADSVIGWLRKENVTLLSEEMKQFGILDIRLPVSRIRDLSALPYIVYVQELPGPDTHENYKSTGQARANVLRSPNGPYPGGLTGQGVVIGVGDDTDPVRHIDFAGRLINRFDRVGGTGHGLHTMGTSAGAGIIREYAAGYAPKSRIVSHYFSNILAYSPVFYHDFGMRLTNNSYGQTIRGDDDFRLYDLYSAVLDQMTGSLPDLLHVFAAGNSGADNYPNSPYHQSIVGEAGFGTIHKSYQSAKNVLTTGNIDSVGVRAANSSRGPVSDGRLKPEIVAQGRLIYSAIRDNLYGRLSGTSMAAPAITGGAALLSEHYSKLYPAAGSPSAALLKALLCNGATDLGLPGPDYSYGYGAMNLLRSSEMLKNGHFVSHSLTTGQSRTTTITVPPNTAQLKVMLCWNDAPGHPLSSRALVNDLDLHVGIDGNNILPFINNPDPLHVRTPATRGIDRLNNIEQVVIENPQAGPADIVVSGYATPAGPQEYYLVYDLIPAGTTLTAPFGGERYVPGDKTYINWDSFGPETGFHLEYFDGTAWIRIVSDLPASDRQYYWTVPAHLATDAARVRVLRTIDGAVSTGGEFVVIGQPVLSISGTSEQCEGMISVTWSAVPGATGYELMKLEGDEMTAVASVASSQSEYSFTGLSKDSTYWVSVRALTGESAGLRAIAQSRRPDNGGCGRTVSDGDLAVTGLLSPSGSGRLLTSTALSAAQQIRIRVKNLDNTASPVRPATISYKINDGPAIVENITLPAIASLAEHDLTFGATADLAALGTYEINVSLATSGDQILANNALVTEVSQLPNHPLILSLSPSVQEHQDDLSGLADRDYYQKRTGLEGGSRYDFESSHPGGRLRSFVNSGMARSGNRAITLDADTYPRTQTTNYLIGTYNLAGYNAVVDDVRLDFWYMQHGQHEGTQNKLWVRGSDTAPWIEAFDLLQNQAAPGQYKRTPSIELNDYLRAHGQAFSSSTQIRWGQEGTYQAATASAMNGYSFDDIRLSLAQNDIQLKEITFPAAANCGMGSSEPVTVLVYNSMSYPLSGITASYQVDNGPIITESIPSISQNSELSYTFAAPADLGVPGSYTLKAWVSLAGDSEPSNNELVKNVVNAPLVAGYPYLEDFENDNGWWRTEGALSSWEYGTPASTKISRAASGTKAWKTRLTGNYNDNELSYLYSPCFDISELANPTLSFMVALDIEDCGENTFCDGAWLEYSYDGVSWNRLGLKNEGTNWYNRSFDNHNRWSQEDYSRWHVATIPLPADPFEKSIRLRFVMGSDLAGNREGIAIDDIHIYDRIYEIAATAIPAVSHAISSSADTWTDFISGNQVIASFNPKGSTPVPGVVQSVNYLASGPVRNANNTYYHHRSFVIQPSAPVMNPGAAVRLYFTDAEMEAMLNATSCPGCENAASVIDLGISKYSASDKTLENGVLTDNTDQKWEFIAPSSVAKVPFGNGYYLEFTTGTFSEFWLSPAAIFATDPLPVRLERFTASRAENNQVVLEWVVSEMTGFSHFQIERAAGNEALKNGDFRVAGNVFPGEASARNYRFTDPAPPGNDVIYYRLKMIDLDGSYLFSDLRSVAAEKFTQAMIYPNPSENGIFFLAYQGTDEISYRVTDISGREVKTGSIPGDGPFRRTVIDLKGLASGAYLIEVASPGERAVFKVIRL